MPSSDEKFDLSLYERLEWAARSFAAARWGQAAARRKPRSLGEARRRLLETERELSMLREERDEMVRRLVWHGSPPSEVAQLAGVSRARVSQLTKYARDYRRDAGR